LLCDYLLPQDAVHVALTSAAVQPPAKPQNLIQKELEWTQQAGATLARSLLAGLSIVNVCFSASANAARGRATEATRVSIDSRKRGNHSQEILERSQWITCHANNIDLLTDFGWRTDEFNELYGTTVSSQQLTSLKRKSTIIH